MLSCKLLALVEKHSDELAARLLKNIRESPATKSLGNVPPEELEERVRELYAHLGQWLVMPKDEEMRRRYSLIGALRYSQGVELADLIWAMALAKHNVWEFLECEGIPDRLPEVFGELDLLQLMGNFFDRVIHYTICGYEEARSKDLNRKAA